MSQKQPSRSLRCRELGIQPLFFLAAILAVSWALVAAGREIPAFPGAEGFGSTTPGGRGGKILFVSNLNDSGPGSLRAACEADGPRIIIFRTSGLIVLAKPIVVQNPYLTLAGQTAPGDGICLRSSPFVVATHDVVVRYLRSRLGDQSGQESDCITLGSGARDVILDHCSATWSVDEVLSLAGDVGNATVQWSLIAEGLNKSIHSKGPHGYGSLARADGPISLHHNLWANNDSRNPRLGDNYGKPPFPVFDVRNNVIYNYGAICSGLTQGVLKVNYVANYIKPGPSSRARSPIRVGAPSDLLFYIRDNFLEGNTRLTADNSLFFDPVEIEGKRQVRTVAELFAAPQVHTTSAQEAYQAVLASVGASLPVRDSVDARIVDEVRRRAGSIIDSQKQVGGWPEYRTAQPPEDTDNDGMPDAWETAHGLNPRDPNDASLDRDGDGYANIEEYLNSLTLRGAPALRSGDLMPVSGLCFARFFLFFRQPGVRCRVESSNQGRSHEDTQRHAEGRGAWRSHTVPAGHPAGGTACAGGAQRPAVMVPQARA